MNEYNAISSSYNFIKYAIFGNSLDRAAAHYFSSIPNDADVLVVGGGKAKYLQELPPAKQLTLIDSSGFMLKGAEKLLKPKFDNLKLIHSDIKKIDFDDTFDVIIIGFFLDQFTQDEGRALLKQLNQWGNESTLYLISDFKALTPISKLSQRLLHRAMIMFINLSTSMSITKVPDIPKNLQSSDFKMISYCESANGMLFASVWKT